MTVSKPAAVSLILAAASPLLVAATPLPGWYGQPGTTRQGFGEFNSASQTPAADVLENPFGTAAAQITLGSFADGWQDPGDPIDLSGVNADGAWDLGVSGRFSVSAPVVPAAPAPGQFYRVDFQVYAVGYSGITALPNFSITGVTPAGLNMTTAVVAADPMFPGASWNSRTWTGYFDTVSPGAFTFNIAAPASNTSVVDTVEVFTRLTLVPEPGTPALALLAWGWLMRRRRC